MKTGSQPASQRSGELIRILESCDIILMREDVGLKSANGYGSLELWLGRKEICEVKHM